MSQIQKSGPSIFRDTSSTRKPGTVNVSVELERSTRFAWANEVPQASSHILSPLCILLIFNTGVAWHLCRFSAIAQIQVPGTGTGSHISSVTLGPLAYICPRLGLRALRATGSLAQRTAARRCGPFVRACANAAEHLRTIAFATSSISNPAASSST